MPATRAPVLVCLGLVASVFLAVSPAAATIDLEALSWPIRCEVLKGELSANPAAGVTYAERPAALPMVDVWPLHVHGFTVPVPALTYTDVLVSREGTEPLTVVLVGLRQNAVIVASMPVEPLDDIFATTDWTGNTASTDLGREWTNELFGGPADLGQLTDLGYRSAPPDLTCDPAAWRTEIPIAIALSLKGFGPGELSHVYPALREGLGWLTERRAEGQIIWEATRSEPNRVWFANLSGPENGPMRDLGFAIDHPDFTAASEPPAWLDALNAALAEADDRARWAILADTLAAEGMSGRSVEAARALAAPAE